jgi:hypothetical protein
MTMVSGNGTNALSLCHRDPSDQACDWNTEVGFYPGMPNSVLELPSLEGPEPSSWEVGTSQQSWVVSQGYPRVSNLHCHLVPVLPHHRRWMVGQDPGLLVAQMWWI